MGTSTHTRTETLEERFVRLLNEAIEAGETIRDTRKEIEAGGLAPGQDMPIASRENSLAVTNAEQAVHWAEKDLDAKTAQGAESS